MPFKTFLVRRLRAIRQREGSGRPTGLRAVTPDGSGSLVVALDLRSHEAVAEHGSHPIR